VKRAEGYHLAEEAAKKISEGESINYRLTDFADQLERSEKKEMKA
jgi:hypothetical protein